MKLFDRVFIFFLGLFTVSACGDDEPPLMYGTPTAEFEIKGTVTDEDGKAITNAVVNVYQSEYPVMLLTTDSEGKYYGRKVVSPKEQFSIHCHTKDDAYIPVIKEIKVEYKKDNNPAANTHWMYMGFASEKVDFILEKRVK